MTFNPLFNHLPSSLHWESSQSTRGDRCDIGYKTLWQVPGTKHVYEPRTLWKVTHSYYSIFNSCRTCLFSRTQLSSSSPIYICEKHARQTVLNEKRHSLSEHMGEAHAQWPPVQWLLSPGSGRSALCLSEDDSHRGDPQCCQASVFQRG